MHMHTRLPSTAAIAAFGFLTMVSASEAQSLRRPVDSAPTPELSLAALAAQLNPGLAASGGATRVYTNADLKMRPAPVAPITPPFPEIAEPSGILEHSADLEVQPQEPDMMMPEQYGVPIWDGGIFPFFSSGQRGSRPHQGRNFQNAPDPFRAFRRPDVVHFSGNGDFSKPATPSAGIRSGGTRGRSGGHNSGHGGKGK